MKNLNTIIWDSFQGDEGPSYVFFLSVTDGQNANPYHTLLHVSLLVVYDKKMGVNLPLSVSRRSHTVLTFLKCLKIYCDSLLCTGVVST